MRDATILFDLDGTLVDTAPDLVNTLNHVLAGAGLPPVPLREMRPIVGLGARRMLEAGLDAANAQPGAHDLDALLEQFLDHYAANIRVQSRAFAGVESCLKRLAASGAKLGVCTNKREGMSNALLAALGLDGYFGAVAGADTYDVRKPDPGHITKLVADLGGDLAHAVMIGDSATDVAAAKAAKVPVIVVSFGYSEAPAQDLGADAVIGHYDELEAALERFLVKA